ncbi:ROK family protein [Phosphitispora fastidiosa]|uniref:ROK family protein n=1 Tax=Phosphitispora fastidiosa TaxID=2837202 RepID=UPI001E398FE2|nr:ROK family protein [Phosphitispora fastidiosa]MBU7005500.1 hypothetical protein [Phosphitispora fastidiosa]
MRYTMGVHIKANSVKVGMFDLRGHYLHFREENLDIHEPNLVVERLSAGVKYLVDYRGSKYENVAGIGIAIDGQVDFKNGVITTAPEMKWENVPITAMAQRLLDKPVFVDDLLNVIALAELKEGAGWGQKNTITVYFGDCVEVRIIKDGRLLRDEIKVFTGDAGDYGTVKEWDRKLFPELRRLSGEISAGVIVFHGLPGTENESYWKTVNLSWHRHAGKNMPDILPAELGEEAPLYGAAGLAALELR